ncbi:MAG: TIGR02281 family clan AA aspartic protease [Pseudomonadota bacterium]
MSTGVQNLLTEIVKWTALAAIFAMFILNFNTIKSGIAEVAGLEPNTTADAATAANPRTQATRPQGNWIKRTSGDRSTRGLRPSGSQNQQPQQTIDYAYKTPVSTGPTVALSADRRGHFNTPVRINGRPVEVVVDTGATLVAMSYDDARTAGIFVRPSDFKWRSQTANGIAKSARVMIDKIDLGGITVRNVQASVAEPGRLHITLLGMSFLRKLDRVEMRGGKLILQN